MKTRRFARRQDRTFFSQALRWIGALLVLFVVLVLPQRMAEWRMVLAPRLPVELPVIVLALVVLTGSAQALMRTLIVFGLALILFFKLADMAAFFGFDRSFNPVADTLMLPTILDTTGRAGGLAAPVTIVVVALIVLGAVTALLVWVTGVIARAPDDARLPLAILAVAALGLIFTPYASTGAARFVRDRAVKVAEDIRDVSHFRATLLEDPFHDIPPDSRLAALKGNDVLLIFVESYGRSSLDNPAYTGLLRGRLNEFDAALQDKGLSARSAWIVSPTFGGESYLAHSTSVSGLWIDNRQRYAQLLRSDHRTLIQDFNDAGWRTVAVMPEITTAWPDANYFHYSAVYRAPELKYKGKSFDYITMPDQYTLAAFQNAELAKPDRSPVMAEIALVSSHIPWAPLPKFVPWDDVGDGSVFNTARTPESADEIWRDPKRVPEYYALSVDYALQTLMSFVTTYATEKTLVIIVGDHQPMSFIAGENVSHEVPVHIIARDPALLTALEENTWSVGMEPDQASPSWPMNTLRERILGAFTLPPDQSDSRPASEGDAEPTETAPETPSQKP